MPELLEFNPNRGLSFDWHRDLVFDSDRELGFDSDRDLSFNAGRNLGFGKRGPVFRGYVCPVCNASVTVDQTSCTECGAVFETKAPPDKKATMPTSGSRSAVSPSPSPPPAARPPPPPPVRAYPPPPKRIDVNHCVHCGARVSGSDQFCWNCGNPMYTSPGR